MASNLRKKGTVGNPSVGSSKADDQATRHHPSNHEANKPKVLRWLGSGTASVNLSGTSLGRSGERERSRFDAEMRPPKRGLTHRSSTVSHDGQPPSLLNRVESNRDCRRSWSRAFHAVANQGSSPSVIGLPSVEHNPAACLRQPLDMRGTHLSSVGHTPAVGLSSEWYPVAWPQEAFHWAEFPHSACRMPQAGLGRRSDTQDTVGMQREGMCSNPRSPWHRPTWPAVVAVPASVRVNRLCRLDHRPNMGWRRSVDGLPN